MESEASAITTSTNNPKRKYCLMTYKTYKSLILLTVSDSVRSFVSSQEGRQNKIEVRIEYGFLVPFGRASQPKKIIKQKGP